VIDPNSTRVCWPHGLRTLSQASGVVSEGVSDCMVGFEWRTESTNHVSDADPGL
jgi:hypothetical protein